MRRSLIRLALAATLACGLAGAAQAQSLSVPIDQSARLVLPAGTQNVMVGNPAIADVNVLDARTAVLLGRTYGVTNLLITDARGRVLMDRQLVVTATPIDRVSVYRGPTQGGAQGVQNYACAGQRCERTPMPGEGGVDYNRDSAPYGDYADRAVKAAKTSKAAP